MKKIFTLLSSFVLASLLCFSSLAYLILPSPGDSRAMYELEEITPQNNYFIYLDQRAFLGNNYGGRYDDGDKTVIQISGKNYDTIAPAFTNAFPDFEVQRVTYSFSELFDIYSIISEHMKSKTPYTIASVGINEIDNCVIVEIVGLTDENQAQYTKEYC